MHMHMHMNMNMRVTVVGKNDCNVRKTHPRCSMENERHVVLSGPRLWQLVACSV